MMTDASPSKAVQETSEYFILDETGDTSCNTSEIQFDEPVYIKSGGAEALTDLSEGEFVTLDNIVDQLSSADSSPMKTRLVSRASIGNVTPVTRKMRRKLGKRKRQLSLTTPGPSKKLKQTPKTPGKGKRKRNKKNKSVIVVDDSDADASHLPDMSVVEIDDDDDSVIVLSEDETGVCSGSLSTIKKQPQPRAMDTQSMTIAGSSLAKPPVVAEQPFFASSKPQASTANPPSRFSPKKRHIPQNDRKEEPQGKNHFELYNPQNDKGEKKTGLRPIVIDGSNVAFGHGRDRFSSLGLKICVDYFKMMGHEVRAFVPQFRKSHSATVDPQILEALEKDGTLSFTPSRRTDGKMIVSYDDRFIVQYADSTGGVIVSRDNYRDLVTENPEYKDTIHKRLLMFTWVGDTIMFPKDPLGRGGPNLQEFLKF